MILLCWHVFVFENQKTGFCRFFSKGFTGIIEGFSMGFVGFSAKGCILGFIPVSPRAAVLELEVLRTENLPNNAAKHQKTKKHVGCVW